MRRAILAIMLVAGTAQAQLGTGQSGLSTSTQLTNVREYEELRAFGRCLVKSDRRAALAIIATAPGSKEESLALGRHVYGERGGCLFDGTQMSMPSQFARGTIAEGLLGSGGVPAELRLSAPAAGEARDLQGVARCYAVNHRAEVDTVLGTRPGGSDELKAVGAIWAGFKACMPGQSVRLTAPWIRFLLAEAALRLARPTAGSGG